MKWCLGLWIACLWACNPINGVQISGDLFHYKGDKLYFEICGQDTTITVALDSMGSFEADESGLCAIGKWEGRFSSLFATGKECSFENGCEESTRGRLRIR